MTSMSKLTTDNDTLPSDVDLDALFYKDSVLDSTKQLRKAGFHVVRDSLNNRVTVLGHKAVPGYLFKKFLDDVDKPYENQLAGYERRVKGARYVKAHLDELRITNLVVPRKWLCKLPSKISRDGKSDYVVVVERFDILDHDRSRKCYRAISDDALKDLCTIFCTFKRIDFSAKNMPFTPEGKIAFIDTGDFARIAEDMEFRRANYKKNIDKLFTDESRHLAGSLWNESVNRAASSSAYSAGQPRSR